MRILLLLLCGGSRNSAPGSSLGSPAVWNFPNVPLWCVSKLCTLRELFCFLWVTRCPVPANKPELLMPSLYMSITSDHILGRISRPSAQCHSGWLYFRFPLRIADFISLKNQRPQNVCRWREGGGRRIRLTPYVIKHQNNILMLLEWDSKGKKYDTQILIYKSHSHSRLPSF